MTFSPSPFLARLQELKLWQGSYDNLIKKDRKNSESDSIEGIAPLNNSIHNINSSEWDQKIVSPTKPFEVLLEEKLAEYKPLETEPKPKKPFLRKGQGLARFKPKSDGVVNRNSISRQGSKIQANNSNCNKRNYVNDKNNKNEVLLPCKKVETKRILSPLRCPSGGIDTKGIWVDANENDEKIEIKHLESSKEDLKKCANAFNSEILSKMNEFRELRHFLPKTLEVVSSDDNFILKNKSGCGEQTLYEEELEKELKIFEILEQKAENSSFCSTNTSVVNLFLSSTPNKDRRGFINQVIEENEILTVNTSKNSSFHGSPEKKNNCLNLKEKLLEVNKKTDLLHNFLMNLKKNERYRRKSIGSDSEISELTSNVSPNRTIFSDDDKWSSNSNSPTKSRPASCITDTEFEGKQNQSNGNVIKIVDTGVNTSFDCGEVTQINTENCDNCKNMREKVNMLEKKLPNVQEEKAKVMDFVKELEYKRDELNKELRRVKKSYEDKIKKMSEDFDLERKRYIREKVYFETYIKDVQNRPSKKEREEISILKKELADIKELVKLKESKNGATQARLRNQIKFLEKENSDFKVEIEKLQKENSKLSASQKMYRRPTETKMLQEINKNLSKLTEEAFKKQVDTKSSKDKVGKAIPKKKSLEKVSKENIAPKNIKNNDSESYFDTINIPDMSIEQQYENAFGNFNFESPRSNNSNTNSSNEKIEKIFEDGSMLVKYSNGNEKTVSPDGSIVTMKYFNGDIKETNTKEKTIRYFYLENSTWHTQYEDGSEIIEYPDGQKSKKHKSGQIEVSYPDGTQRTINTDGSEESRYPDGSRTVKNTEGEITIFLPNGQKEIHTKSHKRREYPDGTVRILYEDGKIETRYSNGRIRIKDANNVLIMDTYEEVS